MQPIVDDDMTLQAIEFFEANEVPRPVTIRTNTLRMRRRDLAQALINRGVNLEPIGKWTNVGLQVFESSVPIGRSAGFLKRLPVLSWMGQVQHQSI
jgi:ribosomal RNA methyltransferase Nop2